MNAPLLEVRDLAQRYHLPRESLLRPARVVEALNGVSFDIEGGKSLGVVGESGSGKSTLARLVMALEKPSGGLVRFVGQDVNALGRTELKTLRRHFQMVFQDPYGSLDPRQKVGRIVAEPLMALLGREADDPASRVGAMLESVGLRAGDAEKYPHEFSGGQRQRIAIARALITRPKLIVADEPVSALDASVQAQVLNLLADLQAEFGATYMLISHDLAVVNHLCDVVAVLYRGRIVEQGSSEALFAHAAHPYTQALIDAVPHLVPGRRVRAGATVRAEIKETQTSCPFLSRCPRAEARCGREAPALRQLGEGHLAACHFA
jgi:peptide/nickel transport system ATP-binding protein